MCVCVQAGRLENVVGWYHSHPGYGCWLSGIDVSTQMLNQQFQEPFLAVVIDPTRTVSAGKVEIGAFRTYPEGYKPPDEPISEYQTIPLNKIEDFGVHCKQVFLLSLPPLKPLPCFIYFLLFSVAFVCICSIIPWISLTLSLLLIHIFWICCGTNIGWIHCHLPHYWVMVTM